jgi:hypothetical protein
MYPNLGKIMKTFLLVLAQWTFALAATAATLTVTNTDDNGPGSLRQAVADAADGDTINFDLQLPAVIDLSTGPLSVDKDVAIVGSGANFVTIREDSPLVAFHVLDIQSGHAVSISGVTITNGVAEPGFAGGVSNSGNLTLTACAITNNFSHDFAIDCAAGICNSGDLTLISCTISGNMATYEPAGILTEVGTLTLTNCTVSGNAVGLVGVVSGHGIDPPQYPGGGLYASSGNVVITNCTFANNEAAFGGDGIFVADASVQLKNTIVAENGAEDAAGMLVSLGYNLVGNGDAATIIPMTGDQIGTSASPIDPMLGPLQDNGGPTLTHALLPGSPAIDHGGPVAGLTTDQRGRPRPVDDPAIPPAEGGDNSDIGAFEAQFSQSLNISTRADVFTGDNVLDAGFIITGNENKTVLIRGLGPSLARFLGNSVLADPTLELHDASGVIATNDNWQDSHETEIEATGIPPTDPHEAAILTTLSPGSYTAILEGSNGGTGIGLVEVYDLNATADSQLANISTRGFVGTDDDVLIGGFITGSGGVPAQILVRAIGPSLGSMGVADPLEDPTLEIYDQNGDTIAFDDNWKDTQETEIEATGLAPSDNRESAILLTLEDGPYTAIIRGANDTIGTALVEIYNLQ